MPHPGVFWTYCFLYCESVSLTFEVLLNLVCMEIMFGKDPWAHCLGAHTVQVVPQHVQMWHCKPNPQIHFKKYAISFTPIPNSHPYLHLPPPSLSISATSILNFPWERSKIKSKNRLFQTTKMENFSTTVTMQFSYGFLLLQSSPPYLSATNTPNYKILCYVAVHRDTANSNRTVNKRYR